MKTPKFITFTGFDDRTNISDMKQIHNKYPVEWGVLISPLNRGARFPSSHAIHEVVGTDMAFSLHCCGQFTYDIQSLRTFHLPIPNIFSFDRVQINGSVNLSTVNEMVRTFKTDIIIQVEDCYRHYPDKHNLYQLFDTSKGNGGFPDNIIPHPGFMVGYAGGMSPETVLDYISQIDFTKGSDYWIDMESGVRTNGWFDLQKVEDVCKKVYN